MRGNVFCVGSMIFLVGMRAFPIYAETPPRQPEVLIEVPAGRFSIPLGYLFDKSLDDFQSLYPLRGQAYRMDSLSFSFWMPSGDPLNPSTVSPNGLTLNETLGHQYVIEVRSVLKNDSKESHDPIQQLANSMTPTEDYEYHRVGVFLQIISHFNFNTGRDTYFFRQYVPLEHDVESVTISCVDQLFSEQAKFCSGDEKNDSLGLAYHFNIENSHLQDVPQTVIKVFELLSKWKSNGQSGPREESQNGRK